MDILIILLLLVIPAIFVFILMYISGNFQCSIQYFTLGNPGQKYFLSFYTIFILNENIKWLEEFIIYYRNIGFDHFYLYDNDGTDGADGSTTHNKYNFEIETVNNESDKIQLENILNKYSDLITYVKWQPRDDNGKILYGQNEGMYDFISKYGGETTWVAFLDLDEYIFSVNNVNIPEYIRSVPDSVSCLKITQKKFIDRFLSDEKYITQDYRCIDLDVGVEWGAKNIVKCKDFIGTNNIHTI